MDRYLRQEAIEGWDPEVVSNGRILVVGAGATGNEVIKNLALLGVGNLTIVDYDLVEEVNLSRCVLFREEDIGKPKSEVAGKRLKELNPYINAISWNLDIIYDIGSLELRKFDVVVLTVDNLEARLWVNRYCLLSSVPLIDTGIDGLIGNVFIMVPPSAPCLECNWKKFEYQRLAEKYSCSKLGLLLNEKKIPMVITSAAIIGGIAAQEAVKILHKKGNFPIKSGRFIWVNGEVDDFKTWYVPVRENCPGHNLYSKELDTLFDTNIDDTVDTIKDRIRDLLDCSDVEIKGDKEIVYSVICNNEYCGYADKISPCFLGRFQRYICPKCGQFTIVPDAHTQELRNGYSLRSLGIPPNHILHIFIKKGEVISEYRIITK